MADEKLESKKGFLKGINLKKIKGMHITGIKGINVKFIKFRKATKNFKKDFEIFNNNKKLVYLDNAATSQKPKKVIQSIVDYYEKYNANVHRGIHELSEKATLAYENSRKNIAQFINASEDEIMFSKNSTEALNLIAYGLFEMLPVRKGDTILLTRMEHHSNLVQWQQLANKKGAIIKYIEVENGNLVYDRTTFTQAKVVSICHVSNVLGTINNIQEISRFAHDAGAVVVVDGAQAVPHMKIDVKLLDIDFYTFSGHKMLGPTGIGVLYGKKELLSKLNPLFYGGDMVKEVNYEEATFNDLPWKFEAGTPPISEVIALGSAIEYINNIGYENIALIDRELFNYAFGEINKLDGIGLLNINKNRIGIISFNVNGLHPHDVAHFLNTKGVAVRAGYHCAQPLHNYLSCKGSVRASFYFYNDKKDVDIFINSLKELLAMESVVEIKNKV